MKIVVAMSGGVDSSVAAALLAEAGHDVIGLSMQLYDQREGENGYGSCCSLDDLHDAGRVARRLNIPHYIVNFEKEFQRTVVANFVDEYVAGRTPIPCSHCNSDLKFATLLDRARAFGAEIVATGHYARVETDPSTGRLILRRGLDGGHRLHIFGERVEQERLQSYDFVRHLRAEQHALLGLAHPGDDRLALFGVISLGKGLVHGTPLRVRLGRRGVDLPVGRPP